MNAALLDVRCAIPLCGEKARALSAAARWWDGWGLCEWHAHQLTGALQDEWRAERRRYEEERLAELERALAAAPLILDGDQIYYLRRADRAVKIGHTINLGTRVGQLSKRFGELELLAVHEGSRVVERVLHDVFRHLRIGRTEWFREDPALLSHIVKLRQCDCTGIEIEPIESRAAA